MEKSDGEPAPGTWVHPTHSADVIENIEVSSLFHGAHGVRRGDVRAIATGGHRHGAQQCDVTERTNRPAFHEHGPFAFEFRARRAKAMPAAGTFVSAALPHDRR